MRGRAAPMRGRSDPPENVLACKCDRGSASPLSSLPRTPSRRQAPATSRHPRLRVWRGRMGRLEDSQARRDKNMQELDLARSEEPSLGSTSCTTRSVFFVEPEHPQASDAVLAQTPLSGPRRTVGSTSAGHGRASRMSFSGVVNWRRLSLSRKAGLLRSRTHQGLAP